MSAADSEPWAPGLRASPELGVRGGFHAYSTLKSRGKQPLQLKYLETLGNLNSLSHCGQQQRVRPLCAAALGGSDEGFTSAFPEPKGCAANALESIEANATCKNKPPFILDIPLSLFAQAWQAVAVFSITLLIILGEPELNQRLPGDQSPAASPATDSSTAQCCSSPVPQAQRGPSPHGQRAHRVPGHGTTADRGAQLLPEHGRAFPLPLRFALQIFWTGSRMPRERSRPHGSGCLLGSTGPSSPGEGWHGHPAPHAAPLPRHFHRARFSFPSLSPSIGIIGSASSQVMTGSRFCRLTRCSRSISQAAGPARLSLPQQQAAAPRARSPR